ncbi:MAG TPA: DUF3352 domain-containing protein, partial [Candidatus Limnocylindria bacterium]|nr:DUF3352 domain-containing protein [Candidatus Limnocylindria bacterium]
MSYDDEHRDDEQPAAEVLSSSGGALIGAANVLPYPSEPSAPPARRRRGLLVAGAAAAVLAVGGGAWTVGSALSGGGAQPESVVPATAAFYVELDLDPSAGQKVDAYRFLKKFPQLRDLFAESGGLGPGFAKLFDGSDIDYAKDIEPWLGDRFAVALVPGAKKNDPLRLELVLQVTDEKAAESSLGTLVEGVGGLSLPGASVVVRDGYAIVAAEQSFGLGDAPGTDAAA